MGVKPFGTPRSRCAGCSGGKAALNSLQKTPSQTKPTSPTRIGGPSAHGTVPAALALPLPSAVLLAAVAEVGTDEEGGRPALLLLAGRDDIWNVELWRGQPCFENGGLHEAAV
jgi:hypothetical protein